MELQKAILLFFSGLNLDFLSKIATFFTVFGEDMLVIAIIVFIFWCVDKKKGSVSVLVLLLATNVMGILKAIVRFPRPWLVIDQLKTQRMSTATGYSFPSGHTTTGSAAYSSLAVSFKKKWFSILCAVLIFLVGVSRCYLCCHWPLDVLCGWILGIGSCFILYNRLEALISSGSKAYKVLIPTGAVLSFVAGLMGILLSFEKIDYLAFSDLSKSLAIGGGMCIGWCIEDKYCNFNVEKGCWGKKILRYAIGMVGVLIILPLSKVLLQKVGMYNSFVAQLRYFLTAFWAATYPMLGVKLHLFEVVQ